MWLRVRSLPVAAWTFLPNDSFKCCVHVCVCVIFQGCVCSGVFVCLPSIYFYIFHLLVPVVYCNSMCVCVCVRVICVCLTQS